MEYTAETLMVKPIDDKGIIKWLKRELPLPEGDDYVVSSDAVLKNILLDNECGCGFSKKIAVINDRTERLEIKECFAIEVRHKKKTPTGYSIKMTSDFTYWMSKEELELLYLKPEISLKEFMVGRFDYNPRISKNTKEFLELVNDNL